MGRGNALRKAQAELIAGLIILSVIFAVTISLLLKIQGSIRTMQIQTSQKMEFIDKRSQEVLSISGVPNTWVFGAGNLYPAIWINNTGAIPVTLHTLVLINSETGNAEYLIDMANPSANPIVEWAMLNPGTGKERYVSGGYPIFRDRLSGGFGAYSGGVGC